MENWIQRYTLVDRPDQPILVRISRKQGSHALDLDLLATDGENVYRGKVRHNKLHKHKSSSYDGSEEEWLNILQHVLLMEAESHLLESVPENLECVCHLQANEPRSNLSIIIRTRVEDITHRLGSIDLKYSDNTDDVDLFAWTNQTVQSRNELSSRAIQNEKEIKKAKITIETLEKQLQDLFQAKDDHETQLLTKFALLLNEKKLRIRSQQRQLVEQDQPAKSTSTNPKASRKRKRKVTEESTADKGDSDESVGFEDMEVEHSISIPSDANRDDARSTASDSDDLPNDTANPPDLHQNRSDLPRATPPRRELPFPVHVDESDLLSSRMMVDSTSKQNSTAKEFDDDETASDSDEEL